MLDFGKVTLLSWHKCIFCILIIRPRHTHLMIVNGSDRLLKCLLKLAIWLHYVIILGLIRTTSVWSQTHLIELARLLQLRRVGCHFVAIIVRIRLFKLWICLIEHWQRRFHLASTIVIILLLLQCVLFD